MSRSHDGSTFARLDVLRLTLVPPDKLLPAPPQLWIIFSHKLVFDGIRLPGKRPERTLPLMALK